MFKWIRKKFGYRWSAYFVQNKNELYFAMHHDSIAVLLKFFGKVFSKCGNPIPPWQIILNFNHTHSTIPIDASNFESNGDPNIDLLEKVTSLDPQYYTSNKSYAPIMVEPSTNRLIDIDEVFSMTFEDYEN